MLQVQIEDVLLLKDEEICSENKKTLKPDSNSDKLKTIPNEVGPCIPRNS